MFLISTSWMLSRGFRQVAAALDCILSFFLVTVWDCSDMSCSLYGFFCVKGFPSITWALHFYSFFNLYLSCLFVFVGLQPQYVACSVFWRPTLTLSVDKFRYFALCYHLVIIDVIKTATVCGQIVPNHLLCFILAFASRWDIFFGQSSRKWSLFLRNMHRYKDKHYV